MLNLTLYLLAGFVYLVGSLFLLTNLPTAAYLIQGTILTLLLLKSYQVKPHWLLKKRWFDF